MGNNPYAVPPMRRPDGTSRNNNRRCGVAESFQVIEYGVETEFNVSSNVLAYDPSRPEFSYESMHLRPEVTRVAFAALLSGDAEGLAGVAPADEVDVGDVVMEESPCVEVVDVVVDGGVRPVACEHAPAERVDLAEGGGLHPGSFEAEREPADTREEIEHLQGPHGRRSKCRPRSACRVEGVDGVHRVVLS